MEQTINWWGNLVCNIFIIELVDWSQRNYFFVGSSFYLYRGYKIRFSTLNPDDLLKFKIDLVNWYLVLEQNNIDLAEVEKLVDLPTGRQARNESFTVYAIKSNTRNYIYVGLISNLEEDWIDTIEDSRKLQEFMLLLI